MARACITNGRIILNNQGKLKIFSYDISDVSFLDIHCQWLVFMAILATVIRSNKIAPIKSTQKIDYIKLLILSLVVNLNMLWLNCGKMFNNRFVWGLNCGKILKNKVFKLVEGEIPWN